MDSKATTPEKIHMLVLETDETHPETEDRKGSFGEIFHRLFTEAGNAHDPPLEVTTSMHFVVDDPEHNKHGHVPNISEISKDVHAILVTGSMYDAHGNQPWILDLKKLLTELWKTRSDLKFSGVCFGHQMLARVLGAKVESAPGGEWELANTEMELTSIGRKLFRTNDNKLSLHQMHQDQVTTVPSHETSDGMIEKGMNVHTWASTGHTKIQGLYIRDRLFTSQGHLGFDEKMVKRNIEMRQKSGGIKSDAVAAEGKERAHLEHDGLLVAGAIVRFFHGDDHDID